MTPTLSMQLYRGKLYAAGLTALGKPRRNRAWPQLRGKSRKERHRIYMQTTRAESKMEAMRHDFMELWLHKLKPEALASCPDLTPRQLAAVEEVAWRAFTEAK